MGQQRDHEKLLRLHKAGKTYAEIGKIFGRSPQGIGTWVYWLKKRGVNIPPRHCYMPKVDVDKLNALLKEK